MNDLDSPKVQPVRRPQKRQKHKLTHHRNLARAVGARIFVSNGKLFPISRLPTIDKLLTAVRVLSKDSFSSEPETVSQVAWSATSDGELTRDLLVRIAKSINAWQAYLDENPRAKNMAGQRREVQELRDRADTCFNILKQRPRATNTATAQYGFLLAPVQQRQLEQTLNQYKELTRFQKQLARMVFWFSGLRAVERFLVVTSDKTIVDKFKIAHLDKSIDWLESLVRRSKTDGRAVVKEFRSNERFRELMKWMSDRPFQWAKAKGSTLEKISQYILRLNGFKEFLTQTIDIEFPRVLAAWAICDQGVEPLPATAVEKARQVHNVDKLCKFATTYCLASSRPGYNRLLRLIDRGALRGNWRSYNKALDILDRHASEGDVLKVIQAVNPCSIGSDVDISEVKKLVEQCRRFLQQPNDQLQCIDDYLHSDDVVSTALVFFTWLNRFPATRRTSKDKKVILKSLDHLISLTKWSGQCLASQVQAWSDFTSAGRQPMENEVFWPTAVRSWLRRTLYYQRLAGQEPRLPRAFRERARFIAKRRKEFQFLQIQQRNGSLSPGQTERFNYLQNRLQSTNPSEPSHNVDETVSEDLKSAFPVDDARQLRDARRACRAAGVEAIAQILDQTAKHFWTQNTGVPANRWSRPRMLAMARWVGDMQPGSLRLLKQTTQAFKTDGKHYEYRLGFNLQWLAKATTRGILVGKWLQPEPRYVSINGLRIKLEVEKDPLEIYQMGTYFNTCLSQGGCNETSVLANAAQANKQVIYARTEDGSLVGRQLIAINKQMKLVGYNCYANTDQLWKNSKLQTPEYEQVVAEFARYAARIAAAAKVPVCFDEDPPGPESLGNFFWWDDGVHQWDQAAADEHKRILAERVSSLEYVHGNYGAVLTASTHALPADK